MSISFGLVIESLVAVLLLLTIGYCSLLNKRLKLLRNDEQAMRGTIAELVTATEIAERAIGGLRLTVRECDQSLGAQLADGAELNEKLKRQVASGEDILRRVAQIARAARTKDAIPEALEVMPPATASHTDAKSISAAAQAFAERRRSFGRAA